MMDSVLKRRDPITWNKTFDLIETPKEDGDPLEHEEVWIVVAKKLSINIHRTDEGVVVDIFRDDDAEECNEPIASTYAFFNEAGK